MNLFRARRPCDDLRRYNERSLFWRQLRAAWLPAALFAAFAVGLVTNRTAEGSAVMWHGEYALSRGKGEFQVTDRQTYEAVRRRGRWQFVCGFGMVVSVMATASRIRRAGVLEWRTGTSVRA